MEGHIKKEHYHLSELDPVRLRCIQALGSLLKSVSLYCLPWVLSRGQEFHRFNVCMLNGSS